MSFLFRKPDYQVMDCDTYKGDFADQHTLIDVRSQQEFAGGHLPNAINIPLDEVPDRLNDFPKDHPIVLVCASGNRSGQAAGFLVKNGYDASQVYNLKGGTMRWRMKGYPVE